MGLLTRKKKLRFDPDARYKVGRQVKKRAEEIFLSRRLLVARGAVVGGFSVLAARLGYMQLAQGTEYRKMAEDNIMLQEPVLAPRGLILDAKDRILADNRRTWEARIVPAYLPKDEVERQHVLDQIISALSLPDALVLDPNAIPKGQEDLVFNSLVGTMVAMGMKREDEAGAFIEHLADESTRNYLVVVDDALSIDEAAQFRAVTGQLPGVSVMNYLDYLIGNAGAPETPIPIKTGVPKEIALKLEANRNALPGIQMDDSVLIRRYLGGDVMSHVLGYARRMTAELYADVETLVNDAGVAIYSPNDVIGQDGIEQAMEPELRGEKGAEWVERDSIGVVQRRFNREDPNPGNNIKLTLDLELQQAISVFLADAVKYSNDDRQAKKDDGKLKSFTKSKAGAVVAINPKNGDVIAMVSYPHYSNQLFVEGISQRQVAEYFDDKVGAALLNRSISARFPSGSTIKPFIAASALRDKTLKEDTQYTCTGGLIIPLEYDESKGQVHPCWNKAGHGPLDVYGGIEQSCDVFFYNVGIIKLKLDNGKNLHYYDMIYNDANPDGARGESHDFDGTGIDRLAKGLKKRFWFGRTTEIELPNEYPGLIPDPEWKREVYPEDGWSPSATANTSIGQGDIQVTPLQLALNCAAIANKGTVWKPHVVAETQDQDGETLKKSKHEKLRKLSISENHFDAVREGMRRVVEGEFGSARVTYLADGSTVTKWPKTNPEGEEAIVIGGKTGTAETGKVLEDGTYDRQHAWFMCFAPYDDPEIAIAVVIEDGGEGSTYAVPVADKTLRAFFEISGRRERTLLKKDGMGLAEESPEDDDALPKPGETQSTAQD